MPRPGLLPHTAPRIRHSVGTRRGATLTFLRMTELRPTRQTLQPEPECLATRPRPSSLPPPTVFQPRELPRSPAHVYWHNILTLAKQSSFHVPLMPPTSGAEP